MLANVPSSMGAMVAPGRSRPATAPASGAAGVRVRDRVVLWPMQLVDTHSHLAAPEFANDLEEVIARAKDAGVEAAVVVGEDYEDNLRVLDLAAREPFVRPALGLHPWRIGSWRRDLPRTLQLISDHAASLVAVGEVGLDYRVAESEDDRALQRYVLGELVAAATQYELPLSLHGRSAGHYLIALLIELGARSAVLHAFDGKVGHALNAIEHGYCVSLPPTTLFSRQKQKLARALPLEGLMLESDAPALGPEPGARSLPEHVRLVAAKVAEIRGIDVATVAEVTRANVRRVFDV